MAPRQFAILISGASGAGKSTLCRRLIDAARRRSVAVGGVMTEARVEAGHVVGLDAVNVATGERVALAEYERSTGGPTTCHWHFHESGFDTGVAWCRAVPPHHLFIVDELGPLELVQGLGWAPLVPLLRAHDGPAIVVVRPSLVDAFAAVIGDRAFTRIGVTPDTREAAFERALDALGLSA